jgi:hypothetical protein
MEGTCFLRPKASDKEKMRSLPPPEDEVDPDGAPTTIVADSDDEHELPNPVVAPTPVAPPAPTKVVEEVAETVVEEVKPKKKIVRKKTDA